MHNIKIQKAGSRGIAAVQSFGPTYDLGVGREKVLTFVSTDCFC